MCTRGEQDERVGSTLANSSRIYYIRLLLSNGDGSTCFLLCVSPEHISFRSIDPRLVTMFPPVSRGKICNHNPHNSRDNPWDNRHDKCSLLCAGKVTASATTCGGRGRAGRRRSRRRRFGGWGRVSEDWACYGGQNYLCARWYLRRHWKLSLGLTPFKFTG